MALLLEAKRLYSPELGMTALQIARKVKLRSSYACAAMRTLYRTLCTASPPSGMRRLGSVPVATCTVEVAAVLWKAHRRGDTHAEEGEVEENLRCTCKEECIAWRGPETRAAGPVVDLIDEYEATIETNSHLQPIVAVATKLLRLRPGREEKLGTL